MRFSLQAFVALSSLLAVSASASPGPKSACNGAAVYGLQNCQPLYSNGEVVNLEHQHNALKLIGRDEPAEVDPADSPDLTSKDTSDPAPPEDETIDAGPVHKRADLGSKACPRNDRNVQRDDAGAEDTGSKAYFGNGGGARPWRRDDVEAEDTGSKAYFGNGNAAKPFKR